MAGMDLMEAMSKGLLPTLAPGRLMPEFQQQVAQMAWDAHAHGDPDHAKSLDAFMRAYVDPGWQYNQAGLQHDYYHWAPPKSSAGVTSQAASTPAGSAPQPASSQPASSPAASQPAAYSGPYASQSQINSALQQRFAYSAAHAPAHAPAAPAITPTTSSPTAAAPASAVTGGTANTYQGTNPLTGQPLRLPGAAAAQGASTLAPGQRMQSGINPAMIDPQYRPSGPLRTPGAALTPGGGDTMSPAGAAPAVPPRGQSGFWANYYGNAGNAGAGYGQRLPGGMVRSSSGGMQLGGTPQPSPSSGLNYPSSLGLGNFYAPHKMGQAQTMNTGAANANFLGQYAPRY